MARSETTGRVREAGPDPDGAITTSIVLPAYNEAGNLRDLLSELVETLEGEAMAPYRPAEIIVVDDGSTDGSREILRELVDEIPQLRVVFLARNFGQSAALAAGIDHAAGTYVVTMDADRQNNPADIPDLMDELERGYDCVSGWRTDREDPITKRLPSKIQTYLARKSGPDLHDFGCTLKAYRADALRGIDLYGEGHRYIPAKLHKRGFRMTELEVDHRPRTEGRTKYGWRRLVKGFMDLVFHIFWNRYSTRPLHFLGPAGLLLMAAGGLIGIHAVFIKYVEGASLVPRLPRLILVTALVLFGLQMLMFGFLAEMITKIHYTDRRPYEVRAELSGGASSGDAQGAGDINPGDE